MLKTQGPLCYAELKHLRVALNQFLLTEGHEYLIQVQAVSNAGAGLWSLPLVKYQVPIISQYYLKLTLEISGAAIVLLLLILAIVYALK